MLPLLNESKEHPNIHFPSAPAECSDDFIRKPSIVTLGERNVVYVPECVCVCSVSKRPEKQPGYMEEQV